MRRTLAGVRCSALLALGASLAAPEVAGDPAVPFAVRNLNPLTAVFGLPTWRAQETATELSLTTELANHYRLSQRGTELLVLDGETWRTQLGVARSFGRWRASLELAHYRQSGGVLDGLIDAWHSAFGLPEGGRNNRPDDQLYYVLGDRDRPFLELERSAGGIGDVQLAVARQLGAGGFTLQAGLKLPTGDERLLAGSGAPDWSLTLLRTYGHADRARPRGWFWGVGVLALGEPEVIEFAARSAAYVGLIGGGWQVGRRVGLKAQLDVHGPLYASPFEEIGKAAVQASFGGWLTLTERAVLELAVVEDVEVSTAPDVVLHATLRWTF